MLIEYIVQTQYVNAIEQNKTFIHKNFSNGSNADKKHRFWTC